MILFSSLEMFYMGVETLVTVIVVIFFKVYGTGAQSCHLINDYNPLYAIKFIPIDGAV